MADIWHSHMPAILYQCGCHMAKLHSYHIDAIWAKPHACHIVSIWQLYGCTIWLSYSHNTAGIWFSYIRAIWYRYDSHILSHIAATLILYSRHMAVQCDFYVLLMQGLSCVIKNDGSI